MDRRDDPAFEALLEFLKRSRGFDFTGYKRTSLERRFRRRMDTLGCESFGDYLDHLEVHPEEYEQLFDAVLVTVTEFFRDPPAWEYLREEVLPPLLAAKAPDEPVRAWSAGCATGQEAYTTAIVLAELLGEGALRERVKIYATDIDEEALAVARLGVYGAKEMASVPPQLRERYFERADQRQAFRKDLRRTVVFGRNNLVSDAPVSRLDLLVCRNTLLYFTAETQGRVLRRFHFALRDRGVLMLGRSETMISHRELFEPADRTKRIFRRTEGASMQAPASPPDRQMRDAALELGPYAQVIVSRAGALAFANLAARALFGLGPDDLGRPLHQLEITRGPAELASAIDEAMRERRTVALGEQRFTPRKGDDRLLDVKVAPLLPDGETTYGASVVFQDVSRYAILRRELEANQRELELAYEQLQCTIEALETTNEVLQSANEELERMNEELQTINDDGRDRTADLNEANEFLEAVLTSMGVGLAVVDRQQRVHVWNRHAEDLWGLRSDEAVDRQLLSLDIGLPVERLAGPLRTVLGGASEREHALVEAVNRRGRTIECATTILPLLSPDGGDGYPVRGAIVVMENAPAGERLSAQAPAPGR